MKKIVYTIEFSGKAVADTQDIRTLVRAVGETLFYVEGRSGLVSAAKQAFYDDMSAPHALTTDWCSKLSGSELRYIAEAIVPKNMHRTTLDKMATMMFLLFGKSNNGSNVRELYINIVSEAAKKRAEQRLMQTTIMKSLFKEFKAKWQAKDQPEPATPRPLQADLLNTLKAREPEKKEKEEKKVAKKRAKAAAKKSTPKKSGFVILDKMMKKPAKVKAAKADEVLTPDVQKLDSTGAPKAKGKVQKAVAAQAQQPQA